MYVVTVLYRRVRKRLALVFKSDAWAFHVRCCLLEATRCIHVCLQIATHAGVDFAGRACLCQGCFYLSRAYQARSLASDRRQ